MKFKWNEPVGAKRARDGSFRDIFLTKAMYGTIGFFAVMFFILMLGADPAPGGGKLPLPLLLFYLTLIAVGASFVIRLILWVFPATICVDDTGIHYQLASEYRTDRWEDISGVRIEQRAGWKSLVYTVNGTEQRDWGIAGKVPALDLQNRIRDLAG